VKKLKVVIKNIDSQGRVVIPKKWREKYLRNGRVIMRIREHLIEIFPESIMDLTKYFDTIEVDIESDLSNWNRVRKELRKIG